MERCTCTEGGGGSGRRTHRHSPKHHRSRGCVCAGVRVYFRDLENGKARKRNTGAGNSHRPDVVPVSKAMGLRLRFTVGSNKEKGGSWGHINPHCSLVRYVAERTRTINAGWAYHAHGRLLGGAAITNN